MKEFTFDSYFDKDHLNDEALALFAEAMMLNRQEVLPEVVREHVEDCLQCKKEIIALYDFMRKDNVFQKIHKHPYFDNPIIHKGKSSKIYDLLKITAVFLLIIGISSLVYYVFIYEKNINIKNNKLVYSADSLGKYRSDSISQKSKETGFISKKEFKSSKNNALAMNMKESVLFESLIASHYRSNDLEVSFPPLNHPFSLGKAIVFKINGDISEPIALFIFNNEGKRILEKGNISVNCVVLTQKLSTGLYYWKLLKDDNLIQVGKFIVK